MFVNFGTSDKVNLDVLEIGYIFRVGEAGSPCFFDLTVFSENFSGSSSGGQIEVLENDVSRNLLCLEFIDISVLSDTPGCGRGNISGCVTIIYEKLEQKW